MTYLTYLNYGTSAGNSDGEPVASHFVHRSELRLSITYNCKLYLKKLAGFRKIFLNLVATATLKNLCYDILCGISCNSIILHTYLAGVERSAHSKVTSLFPTIPGLFYARNLFFTHKTATL